MDDAALPASPTAADAPAQEAASTPDPAPARDPVAPARKRRLCFQKGRIMKTRRGTVPAGFMPARVPAHPTIMTLAMTRHATEVQDDAGVCKIIRPLPHQPVDRHGDNEFKDDGLNPRWGHTHIASFVEQVHDQAHAIESVIATMRDDDNDPDNHLVVRTLCSQGINRGPMLAHCLAGALHKRGMLREGEVCNDVPLPQREHILAYTHAFVEAPEGEEVQAMLATEA